MGYTDIRLIVDGAVAEESIFEDGRELEREAYEEGIQNLAASIEQRVELDTQYHGHNPDGIECVCAQYNDGDQRHWDNGKEIEP